LGPGKSLWHVVFSKEVSGMDSEGNFFSGKSVEKAEGRKFLPHRYNLKL
jgi:hypothetical protein